MITIFTPTYNRANLLLDLYNSICCQTCYDFEWIIIDDGSTDSTHLLFKKWESAQHQFPLRLIRSDNKGKCYQINHAVKIARGEWFFIVDSDDYLLPNAIENLVTWTNAVKDIDRVAGVSGIKVTEARTPLNDATIAIPNNPGYVTASNLERSKYGLKADMAECYRTALLIEWPFQIWPGEKFVSEGQVWNKLADKGYVLRWYRDSLTVCRYQPDGLSNSYWKLLKNNPMGFADMFSDAFKRRKSLYPKCRIGLECLATLMLAKNIRLSKLYLPYPFIIAAIIPAYILYIRRKRQIKLLS